MRFATSSLSSSLRLASAAGLLTVLAVSAGHAQTTQLIAPPAGYTVNTTDAYPLNDSNGGFINGPFTVAAGSTNVTFTATNPGTHSFETSDNFDGSLDFPINTVVIDTFDGGDKGTGTVTGPLQINFSSGVSAFGLNVESARDDTATFSFTAYDGANIVGSYTLVPVTQTEAPGDHHSVFLGAQAINGSQITSVVISDLSVQLGYTGGSNDFFSGPLSTYTAPVPEASTTVSFGLLLALGLGGAIISARKKMGSAKASTA